MINCFNSNLGQRQGTPDCSDEATNGSPQSQDTIKEKEKIELEDSFEKNSPNSPEATHMCEILTELNAQTTSNSENFNRSPRQPANGLHDTSVPNNWDAFKAALRAFTISYVSKKKKLTTSKYSEQLTSIKKLEHLYFSSKDSDALHNLVKAKSELNKVATTEACNTLLKIKSKFHGGQNKADNCDEPLASSLPPAAFDSSSELFGSFSTSFAKLNRRDGTGGWTPLESNTQQWLQIDLGDKVEITAVATQGRYGSTDWVTSYAVMFSDTGHNWKQYRQEHIWAFTGNTNADTVVQHTFQPSIKARFLRFVPLRWNANGKIGMRVEVFGCTYRSYVAEFDGRSYLLYRFNQKQISTVRDIFSLKFKSMENSGVLFSGEGQRGDYIMLQLQKGSLSLDINLGGSNMPFSSSHTSVNLGSLLDDQHWHSVLIERFNKQVNFTVDRHTQQFRTKGDANHLDIAYELSFGGIPLQGKPGTVQKNNFHGCMENLYYNGINIIDLAKRRKLQIYTEGNVTFSCSKQHIVPITFVSSSSSFLFLPGTPYIDGLSVSFHFRTWNQDGLLLSTELSEGSGVLLLYLLSGKLNLVIEKVTEISVEISTATAVNDGLWHSVNINARRHRITLTLDNGLTSPVHANSLLQIFSGDRYYFGGCPANSTDSQCLNPFTAFQGCMKLIFIDNQPKDLILVQQGTLGNYSDLHIDLCSIRDRCLPNLCEHGAKCSQSWGTFSCDCTGTGYSGSTCHRSIHEESCEVYRHKGNASGFYSIDTDGSGPLGPMRVYCNMTEDKTWTVIGHNNTELTKVQGYSVEQPYSYTINYGISMQQLEAMINSAEYCEQEVAYHCRRSRLLNSPGGTPFTWWVSRTGEKQTYWGGSLPGIQQCACGLEENCWDLRHYCNCDADKIEWTNDTGLLTFKDHLPVAQIVITDTSRTNSAAAWRVSPLRCYGARSFWNAATFLTEASYLHFSKFPAELSADISFFFKMTAVSGVFLENLGVADFLRVVLHSPAVVMFSFDVGNGLSNISVQSPTPLNDNQWHYVRAEKNVQEALLQVDSLPGKVTQMPSEGHFRLQLNTQFFVGGTASRQGGFLGCIRSLHLNGQVLDLEERARVTSGVKPGCTGHCSSYGKLCHNGGKCIEKYNGSTCDCTSSAYEGPFCKNEVSALFASGSTINYAFREPYTGTMNASVPPSSIYADTGPPKENISFKFLTAHAPCILISINYFQNSMAVILSQNGSLQVRYKLNQVRTTVLTIDSADLAKGDVHFVQINRDGKEVSIQVDQYAKARHTFSPHIEFKAVTSLTLGKVLDSSGLDSEVMKANRYGFVGCLSSVLYNQYAPLKAALKHPTNSPVTVKGALSESSCGSISEATLEAVTTIYSLSDDFGKTNEQEELRNAVRNDSAVIGGLIAVIIFLIFCFLAVLAKCLYQHKAARRKNETREKEYPEHMNHPFRNQTGVRHAVSECKKEKEYYI
ncbi:contactin-associated protein-like 5 [Lissotriton helveticus]